MKLDNTRFGFQAYAARTGYQALNKICIWQMAEVGGVPVANDLESVECPHVSLQGNGPDSAIQGDSQARWFHRRAVLAILLTDEEASRPPPATNSFPLSDTNCL
jgi:hypothetical protein